MSNNINELAFEIRCKVEQITAITRAGNYMRDELIRLNVPMSAEKKAFEVIESITEEFLNDIDKLAEKVGTSSNTANHKVKEGALFGKL